MMIGVAQVIGMNPTLRSRFSGVPVACANTSLAAANGNSEEIAAIAVGVPTADRNARRRRSSGNNARTTA